MPKASDAFTHGTATATAADGGAASVALATLHDASQRLRSGMTAAEITDYVRTVAVERLGADDVHISELPEPPDAGETVRSFALANSHGPASVLIVRARHGDFFTDDRAAAFGSLANLAALGLSEARACDTLRRRAADLQLALDAGHMGVFDWDMSTGRLIWDANHAELFGVTLDAFDGTIDAFTRCVHPDDLPEVEWAVAAARQARAQYEQEFRVVWPDGSVHWVAGRGRFAYDAAGRAVRMNGFTMDIDRRHAAEETARAQHEQLAHLLRLNLLSQLASGLAHEINQPLSAISNFAGAALQLHRSDALTGAKSIEVLTEIQQQSQRAGDIVRRLRQFMAKRGPRMSDCDLNAVVADATAFMESELSRARVRPRLVAAANLPKVRIDPVQIQQVLVNLIQNALDAMDETPPRDRQLTISTIGSVEQVIVRVSDAGKGIGDADLRRIFDSFFSTKSYGMGLGLNISRSIIEAHGGHLTAFNNADGLNGGGGNGNGTSGATFEFVLPLEG